MILRAARRIALLAALLLLAACATTPSSVKPHDALDALAENYVQLLLALGTHDPLSVDAYYGPQAWHAEAQRDPPSLTEIERRSAALGIALDAVDDPGDPRQRARQRLLSARVGALHARARQLQGAPFSFDEEAQLLYGVTPPHFDEADFSKPLARLEQLLPGEGTLAERYERFVAPFNVPPVQIEALMQQTIAEARQRTRAQLALPEEEHIELALVTQQPWAAYNWYQGGYLSRIEINTEQPLSVRALVALAVHEGYPGHHVQNLLLESRLLRERGWIEYCIYPLFSPQALIAEGAADLGVGLVFPGAAYARIERALMQQAGLPLAELDRYRRVQAQVHALRGAPIEAARRYLDGALSRDQALQWLQTYALLTPARAQQRLQFIERYRSYIINYSYGQQRVRDWLLRSWWARLSSEARWRRYAELLAEPHTPADLLHD